MPSCCARRGRVNPTGSVEPVKGTRAETDGGDGRRADVVVVRLRRQVLIPGALAGGASRENRRRRRHGYLTMRSGLLAVECRYALAGGAFQVLAQRPGVVGDQFHPVTCTADLDIEALLRSQMRMIRLNDGDHVVDGASLERMQGRCPCMIEMPQLRVIAIGRAMSCMGPWTDPTPGGIPFRVSPVQRSRGAAHRSTSPAPWEIAKRG